MANKTVLKKESSKFKAGSRYFTSGDARAYLLIHLSKLSNCKTEFSELTRTPSRKYIYFWKAMINTAAKKKKKKKNCTVVNFHRHSQESTAKRHKRQFL